MSTQKPNPPVTANATRPPKGEVLRRSTRGGDVSALRFTAYGKRQYVTLGTAGEVRGLAVAAA